jgi:site-specific recombinase XerD
MANDIETVLESFKEDLLRQEKSKNTVRAYVRDVEEFIQWFSETVGEFSPGQITVVDVQEYKNYLYNIKRNKPVSVNRKLSALESFCEFLVSAGHLKDNPAAKVKKIKQQKTAEVAALSNSELYRLKRMFYLEGNKRDIAIFELMINTGLREAEVCNLKLDDVVMSERKGIVIVRSGKGEKYREVPLNANVRRAIQAYLEVRPNRGNYLFVSNKSDRLSESQLYRIIRKYADMAGIKAHPHMLRHTFATKLLREGKIDLPTLQNLLGHVNINTTAVYTRATMQDLEKAVEILESLEE